MIRNPFKRPALAKHFDVVVAAYYNRHKDLIRADGSRHKGNGIAGNFWRGYDNVLPIASPRWNGARDTFAYASYRAGLACAAKDKETS